MRGAFICGGVSCFFFNDTATTEIYTLSLHDALPISGKISEIELDRSDMRAMVEIEVNRAGFGDLRRDAFCEAKAQSLRSEEHTSELQSRQYLVCRLLLEKKILAVVHVHAHNDR